MTVHSNLPGSAPYTLCRRDAEDPRDWRALSEHQTYEAANRLRIEKIADGAPPSDLHVALTANLARETAR